MTNSSTEIPLQGTPGILDPRNPTLLPNFDTPYFEGSVVANKSSAGILKSLPRADATAIATIGGSATPSDEVTLEVVNAILPGGLISVTYTVGASDTLDDVAAGVASLLNDNLTAQAFGIRADVATGGIITVHHNGTVGNFSVLSSPSDEPTKITAGGTALTGDTMFVYFQGPAFNQVAAASDVATLSGTVAAGDTLPLVITNSGVASLPITKTYTVVAGDTLASIAQGLANLVNADATLQAAMISAQAGTAEITIFHNGAIGNNTTLSCTPGHSGGGSEAISFAAGGALSGGLGVPGQAGVVAVAASTTGNSTTQQATALKNAINANAALAALLLTATSTGAIASLTVPAQIEPATISAWVNTTAPQIGLSTNPAAGDILTLTFTGAAIPGSPVSVNYTALLGDTTTSAAAGLAAAVNANAVLSAAGFSATSSTSNVVVSQPVTSGQVRYTGSSTGSTTFSPPTTPTDTLAFLTLGTETVVFTPSNGVMSGGTGPVIAVNNFNFAPSGGGLQSYFYGKPYSLGYDVISQMVTQSMPIV